MRCCFAGVRVLRSTMVRSVSTMPVDGHIICDCKL